MSRSSPPSLDGTTVFVIGGSTGIGRGIADALAAAGSRVVVFSRSDPFKADGEGPRFDWRPLDLSDLEGSRSRLTAAVEEFGGRLDAVFYSAIDYGARRARFSDVPEGEWFRQFNVNLHGLWLTLRLTLPVLRHKAPGLFVGVSSEVVYNGGPERSGYAATKAAAASLLSSLAQEDGGTSVRFVQILPERMVETAGVRRRRPEDFDYSSYMSPESFGGIAVELVRSRGEGLNGESLAVGDDGRIWRANEAPPPSQSRRSA